MAKLRTVTLGGINIRVHPHETKQVYIDLLKVAHSLKKVIRVRGDQHLMLSYVSDQDTERLGIIHGTLARFTEIDMDLPWYNLSSLDAANEDDVEQVNIPESLKPNFTSFHFAFNLSNHKLAVETKNSRDTLSIRIVKKYLDKLFSDETIIERFNHPSIDIISDAENLDQIWKMSTLKNLEISLQKPNPDLPEDTFEDRIQNRMISLNAQKMEQKFKAVPGQSLEPDEETKLLAELAVSNGLVNADGNDIDGNKLEFSSDDHPHFVRERYDPDGLSDWQAFIKGATRLFNL